MRWVIKCVVDMFEFKIKISKWITVQPRWATNLIWFFVHCTTLLKLLILIYLNQLSGSKIFYSGAITKNKYLLYRCWWHEKRRKYHAVFSELVGHLGVNLSLEDCVMDFEIATWISIQHASSFSWRKYPWMLISLYTSNISQSVWIWSGECL